MGMGGPCEVLYVQVHICRYCEFANSGQVTVIVPLALLMGVWIFVSQDPHCVVRTVKPVPLPNLR